MQKIPALPGITPTEHKFCNRKQSFKPECSTILPCASAHNISFCLWFWW